MQLSTGSNGVHLKFTKIEVVSNYVYTYLNTIVFNVDNQKISGVTLSAGFDHRYVHIDQSSVPDNVISVRHKDLKGVTVSLSMFMRTSLQSPLCRSKNGIK